MPRLVIFGTGFLAAGIVLAGLLITPKSASAVPSFARQTGQPCAACHTAFPELTPYGRRFKLGGYTQGGGDSKLPPIAMMLLPSFTNTQKSQDAPPAPGMATNNNLILQSASLFYGGTIYGNLGAFVQATYDTAAQRFFLDNTDIRYADTAKIFGQDVLFGATLHNNPTVQDVWNTTPAWGFPYVASSLAPMFSPPTTMIEGGFAGQVVGTGVYTFWNDMIYAEASGYQTMSKRALTTLGEPDVASTSAIQGVAPYWRLAIEPTWGDHSLMVGTFGMLANVIPGRMYGFGVDRISDFGFDAQYQYNGEMNSFTLKATEILEQQRLGASLALGNSTNSTNRLQSFKLTGAWVYDHTYSLTTSLFDVSGTADTTIYNPNGDAAFGSSMARGKPNGRGLIYDVAYLPFSHGGPAIWPWANVRIGVSYTQYLKLYGTSSNFDGNGHNARDNNTTYAYLWIAY